MKIRGLTIICILCIIIVAITNIHWSFINIDIENKSENIINAISLSYIAAYIFYFLNVYLVFKRERKKSIPYLSCRISLLLSTNQTIIRYLDKEKFYNEFGDYYPNPKEFEHFLKELDVQEIVYNNKNYLYLFSKTQQETLNILNSLILFDKFIDNELRNILFQLNMQSFLYRDFYNLDLPIKDLINCFYQYFTLLHQLQKYYNKDLSQYEYLYLIEHSKNIDTDIYDIIIKN